MFRYPLDSSEILRKKRTLRRHLIEKENLIDKKIALLSGSTIGEISDILELFLLDFGIKPTFFEGGFNRYYEDLVFNNERMVEFAPDIIYIHIGIHNITEMPKVGNSRKDTNELLKKEYDRISHTLDSAKKYNCPVIVNNIEFPTVRELGNRDAYDTNGKIRFITKLNLMLADYADESEYVYINDINYLSGWFGLERWSDPGYYNAYKYAVSPEAIPLLCLSLSSIIKALFGKNKKALMLDLDNTLWGGTIGDDGVEGILLGEEAPKGRAYYSIQQYAKEMRGQGILLGVLSKNDEDIAKEGFTHPSSVLHEEDFSAFFANWNEKQHNAVEAAKLLNIATDSFVFVDDNPGERERMEQSGLDIEVVNFSLPERLPERLSMSGYFETVALSEDDLKRADMYRENSMRDNESRQFSDYTSFLKSLQMKVYLSGFTYERRERITQLINKTNQFNTTTRRYTAEEIAAIGENEDVIKITARLVDKFGDNGLVSILIASVNNNKAVIDLFVMSCRVFDRELEYVVFNELLKQASAKGVDEIEGIYIGTKKNVVIKDLYTKLGFLCTEEKEEETKYIFNLENNKCENVDLFEVIYE